MIEPVGMWGTIATKDSLNYDGIVAKEESQGIYLFIGGDANRLVMFPWSNINRVIYKTPEAAIPNAE
jgi:hypothetical protein